MSRTELLDASALTDVSRFNALRHGVLSRYTVLPWEDVAEYDGLVAALVAEHAPQGPTEEHLVEELAGVIWRKRRLRLAEAASQRRALAATLPSYKDTVKVALVHLDAGKPIETVTDSIRATDVSTQAEMTDVVADELLTRNALTLLSSNRNDAYDLALEALREDTRQWWAQELANEVSDDDKEAWTADCAGLKRFIESEVLPWFETRAAELGNRPLIREQAFGEALDPDKLERLGRYEVHLDRKLERMLSMLVRLKGLRGEKAQI